ncbi:trichohyalin-like [Neocloeon triangulifer]|uniref:trichohyalin-like n=1 Tax=Neocloeon triangulifer TaxID=2078957 RepID=UPI00286F5671|nr:trichohyalin-like [Neocloeon triangulifer]
MNPSDIWHRSTATFIDKESILKEERARRRLVRIQQVRQQSKQIASRVIERSRQLKELEQKRQREKKNQALGEWKRHRLQQLTNELDHGLQNFGQSFKAVEEDLALVKKQQEKKEKRDKSAKERGAVAFQIEIAEREQGEIIRKTSRHKREHLRFVENQRAKAVASLPPILKEPSEAVASCKSSGTKVEVIDFSVPRSQRSVHFTTVPDDVVQKVEPKTSGLSAAEEAEREVRAREKRAHKAKETEQLTKWLGNAANARKALEKQYKTLFSQLKQLEKEELGVRPIEALTVSDLNNLERKYSRLKKKERQTELKENQPAVKMSDENREQSSPQPMDLTEFPGTQFTPEEAGALGATAQSLQTLLDSLAGESRRRLEEVVGEDYYYCSDEDFASPPGSPTHLNVETSSSIHVSGCSASVSTEVSVSVKKHKKKKKKSKKRRSEPPPPQQQSFLSTNSTQYMSPPEHLREDNIAEYLAAIEREKQQMQTRLDERQQPINVPFYINKLLTMTRESVEELSVSSVVSSPSTSELPSKKQRQSTSSSSTASDTRDHPSSYQDGSTAYLSLGALEAKDPVHTQLEPTPNTDQLLNLINAPAEHLVRPLENLRLSTIVEADTSAMSSGSLSDDSRTMDVEAELLRRGLPLPRFDQPSSPALQLDNLPTGDEYLRRAGQLLRFESSSSSSASGRGNAVFHSTPLPLQSSSSSSGLNDQNPGVSPILPSSE